jgi:acyl carrier protein
MRTQELSHHEHTRDSVTAVVTGILSEILARPSDELLPEATLDQLDVDSIVIVELVLGIQKELGVRVELGVITPESTIEEAAQHVMPLLLTEAGPTGTQRQES